MRKRNNSGFTLIEILVAIGIIGVLSSFILSNVSEARASARIAKAKHFLKQLEAATELLLGDTTVWPEGKVVGEIEFTPDNEVWDLNPDTVGLTSTDGSFIGWRGPYIDSVPLDPWGNPYFLDTDYQIDASGAPCQGAGCINAAVFGSFGPNGVGQNVYDADDIILILSRE